MFQLRFDGITKSSYSQSKFHSFYSRILLVQVAYFLRKKTALNAALCRSYVS